MNKSIKDPLTTKQDNFAFHIACGMTQSDAYRTAYDAHNMANSTIWSKASELAGSDKVAERIAYYRHMNKQEFIMSRSEMLEELTTMGRHAEDKDGNKDNSARRGAMQDIAKLQGYNQPEKVEIVTPTINISFGDDNEPDKA